MLVGSSEDTVCPMFRAQTSFRPDPKPPGGNPCSNAWTLPTHSALAGSSQDSRSFPWPCVPKSPCPGHQGTPRGCWPIPIGSYPCLMPGSSPIQSLHEYLSCYLLGSRQCYCKVPGSNRPPAYCMCHRGGALAREM